MQPTATAPHLDSTLRDQSLRYNSLAATGAQRKSGCAGAAKTQSRLTQVRHRPTGSTLCASRIMAAQCLKVRLPQCLARGPARSFHEP